MLLVKQGRAIIHPIPDYRAVHLSGLVYAAALNLTLAYILNILTANEPGQPPLLQLILASLLDRVTGDAIEFIPSILHTHRTLSALYRRCSFNLIRSPGSTGAIASVPCRLQNSTHI